MANTLTNLIPDVYVALDVVSRELTGFIPSVARNSTADRVALNQTLRSIATPANTSGADITAAMSLPSASDQTIGNKSLTITKSRGFKFSWTGEEQKSMDAGPGSLTIEQDQIAQAIRAAVNEIETDIAVAAALGASRAFGTAGTTPFASDLAGTAQLKKILDDNGAPASDRSIVMNTTAGAALRTLLNNPLNANSSLNTPLTQQGVLLDSNSFKFRESAQVSSATAGTAASATTNNAGYAIGATTLTLASAGTGTILAGDVITFAGDTNKYVVATGNADVSSGGTIVLAAPGLRVAMSAATKAITMVATSARNVGFSRNALLLATRLPAMPKNGDQATQVEVITDPRTGLSFELSYYPGFRMGVYFISVAWGVTCFKPEHTALLLG